MADMKLYSTDDVMQILKCTRRTLYNYIKDGRLQGVKVGRKWLFTEEQIKAFLDTCK